MLTTIIEKSIVKNPNSEIYAIFLPLNPENLLNNTPIPNIIQIIRTETSFGSQFQNVSIDMEDQIEPKIIANVIKINAILRAIYAIAGS